jgi:hypothetical protein
MAHDQPHRDMTTPSCIAAVSSGNGVEASCIPSLANDPMV